jgi:hypothetical protein
MSIGYCYVQFFISLLAIVPLVLGGYVDMMVAGQGDVISSPATMNAQSVIYLQHGHRCL